MDNQEIVQKAVEKAIQNGFYDGTEKVEVDFDPFTNRIKQISLWSKNYLGGSFKFHPLEILFSIPFAKAFWGEKDFDYEIEVGFPDGTVYDVARLPAWQYHLQQMVLEDEPIKYLEKHV